jgi:DNA-binding NarL/FixJ family response regulator
MISVALVDDHSLLRNGLKTIVDAFSNYQIIFEASNGKDFVQKLKPNTLPDIVLMDITMPEMDGFETTSWIAKHYPSVKVLALSMLDNETAIIRMLKCGAKGYLMKDCEPTELKAALDTLISKGTYFNEQVRSKIVHSINKIDDDATDMKSVLKLKEKEIEFLKWACTEKSYKEIAEEMILSPRTIDHYRDALFAKLNVKTRVGLAMYAIRNGIYTEKA